MDIQKVFEDVKGSDKVPELKLYFKQSLIENRRLDTTEERVDFLREIFDEGTFELQEESIVVPLDSRFRPIAFYKLAKGTSDEVPFEYRMLFTVLLGVGADYFFIAHNHPDKTPFASYADLVAAHSIGLRALMFGIKLVDSIVLANLGEEENEDGPGYFSLEDNGLLFE